MVQIFYMGIIRNVRQYPSLPDEGARELVSERDLSIYNRFTKGTRSEFMSVFARIYAEQTRPGMRQCVITKPDGSKLEDSELSAISQHKEDPNTAPTYFAFHSYGHSSSFAAVIITRVSISRIAGQQVLSKMVDEFSALHPKVEIEAKTTTELSYPALAKHLQTYQNSKEIDSLAAVQAQLDETKIIMHKTIESVLERGEKIDSLVAKSDGLSAQSKMFYQQAKKNNSCCVVM